MHDMHERTTRAVGVDGDPGVPASSPGKFTFIRAAAGFVVPEAPAGGVFTAPDTAPPVVPRERVQVESVETVEAPVVESKPKREAAPLAHRLMVIALIPFVLVAVVGMIVINRPPSRRTQPAPAPTAATVPTTVPTTEAPPPPPAPPTTVPRVAATKAPVVPATRAPRAPRVAPTSPTTVTESPTTTPTTEPPSTTTPTTEPPTTTTPTTEPPTTTTPTTEPPTTTTTPSTQPPLQEQ